MGTLREGRDNDSLILSGTNPFENVSVEPVTFILQAIDPEAIVVINLDRRPDRWDGMLSSWHPDVAQRFTRFSAVDGRLLESALAGERQTATGMSSERSASEIACRQSWIRAVERFGPGLYLEDDARPGEPWPYGLPPETADVVLLGGFLWHKTWQPGWNFAWRGASSTHAIWIRNDRGAEALLRTWRSEDCHSQPVDVCWKPALIESGAVIAVPQMIHQVDLGTDIQLGRTFHRRESSPFDPWCSLEGGLQRAQRSPSWKKFGMYNPATYTVVGQRSRATRSAELNRIKTTPSSDREPADPGRSARTATVRPG